jgi:hypothetical protein
MFSIENNGPYFQASLEAMTDQEITTKMRGAQDRLSDQTISTAHRTLLRCVITEGATELQQRWFPTSLQRIM